jgi:hypothetical protein
MDQAAQVLVLAQQTADAAIAAAQREAEQIIARASQEPSRSSLTRRSALATSELDDRFCRE